MFANRAVHLRPEGARSLADYCLGELVTNLHDDERPFAHHPDMPEGMTQEEYAEWLYRHRDEPGWEPVEAEVSPNLATVVSVRLRRSELNTIAHAAEAAGLKLSTFIRQAALSASSVVDMDAARRDLTRLRRQVDQLADHLGHDDRADRPAA